MEKPHRHPYFEIVWITDGNGQCRIDLGQYPIKRNSIFCIPPGHIHSLDIDQATKGYIISYNREFIHLGSGMAGCGSYYDMFMEQMGAFETDNESEMAEIEAVLSCLNREFSNYALQRQEILSGWLRIFLYYLKRSRKKSGPKVDQGKNKELVNQFYSSLEKDFLKKKMVADYASELFISPNYLNEIVKRISGYTASHHIQQRIVLEAKRLAIYSSASMKEIAYSLGFEDIAYFSKFFKTFSGTNFRDFKRTQAFAWQECSDSR